MARSLTPLNLLTVLVVEAGRAAGMLPGAGSAAVMPNGAAGVW